MDAAGLMHALILIVKSMLGEPWSTFPDEEDKSQSQNWSLDLCSKFTGASTAH